MRSPTKARARTSVPDDMVERVFRALLRGELSRDDVTTRALCAWLGQSTIGLYHHFGSLDGFLIRVDGAGWSHLIGVLEARARRGDGLEALARAYVGFARSHPVLYWIMAERPFDRSKLRAEMRLRKERELLGRMSELLVRVAGESAARDMLLVFATLHGLASLAAFGRFDLGPERETSDRIDDSLRAFARMFEAPTKRGRPLRRR